MMHFNLLKIMCNKPNAICVLLEEAADANQRSGIVGMAALQFGTI